MSMVVTKPCVGCKYTDCVTVCPVECFMEGEAMVYIDPEVCTECGACVSECPVEAIYHEDEVPEAWNEYIAINREMSAKSPQILEKKPPLC